MHRNVEDVSTKLQKIEDRSRADEKVRFTSLAHLLTEDFLAECFCKLNKHGAPGIDGITMQQYKDNLKENITCLHKELRNGQYRASSVKRVYIPKANGKKRPLGIPTVKDRIVQRAVGEIISRVYEPYFEDHSFGFRPGRSCHGALKELRRVTRGKRTSCMVEADIKSYFDTVNHEWMMKFLSHRIADTVILRLVRKWLNAGHMENGVVTRSEDGTPQGGPISPLLANIYLHYVLDLWFERKFKKQCKGKAELIRYADDFVVCFELKEEAERFMKEMEERFAAFNLTLAVDKTHLLEFGKRAKHNGTKGRSEEIQSFEFLGFTHYMRRRPSGRSTIAVKPSRKSRNKFLKSVKGWLKDNRDRNVWFQAYGLRRKLLGYYNYFGLKNCFASLCNVRWHCEGLWFKSLNRRSQKRSLYWYQFKRKPWRWKLPEPKLI